MFIEKNNSVRRLVISDIHGCAKTLRVLIENIIIPSKNDQIFFLGDYIDRGPDSAGVLDFLIELKKQNFNLFFLKGNHEENILNAYKEYDKETFIFFVKRINKSMDLINDEGTIKVDYLNFFNQLEYFFETDTHFIVHAGFNFSADNPFDDKTSMLELRKTDVEKSKPFTGEKTILHGHQVSPLNEIQTSINEKRRIIPLDNGCYYIKPHKIYDIEQTGNLCCFNLDTYELTIQKNVESQ